MRRRACWPSAGCWKRTRLVDKADERNRAWDHVPVADPAPPATARAGEVDLRDEPAPVGVDLLHIADVAAGGTPAGDHDAGHARCGTVPLAVSTRPLEPVREL